jgi:hypothetical protein
MYDIDNNLSNIHPGMRFIRILELIRNKYKTIHNAMNTNDLYNIIIHSLKWKSDYDNFLDFHNIYGSFFSQLELMEEKKIVSNIINDEMIYDIDYLMFKYYKFSKVKSECNNFFVDYSSYITEPELIPKFIEIEKRVHCPVMFNETIQKYQLNVSGMSFYSLEETGKQSLEIDLKKDKDDVIIQAEFFNYILINIFYDLDKQLLYSNKKIDLSIVDKFDIDEDTKKMIINIYKEKRKIKDIF